MSAALFTLATQLIAGPTLAYATARALGGVWRDAEGSWRWGGVPWSWASRLSRPMPELPMFHEQPAMVVEIIGSLDTTLSVRRAANVFFVMLERELGQVAAYSSGTTLGEAVCRAVVQHRFGDTVQVPAPFLPSPLKNFERRVK